MIAQIVTENGVKKIKPLTADIGAGNPVGTIVSMYKKSSPSGYLYCDGSTFDATVYPLLYAYLGSNVLPDYREFALVGAEENTTSSNIATHDIYAQGEEKDDQFQAHKHLNKEVAVNQGSSYNVAGNYQATSSSNVAIQNIPPASFGMGYRYGDVTRGKRKAVYFYIKATSGLSENAQDNVVAQLNEERSYSTEEVNTGKKWIDGKPIYRKVVDFGALPNNASKSVAHNIANLDHFVSMSGIAMSSDKTNIPLPRPSSISNKIVELQANATSVVTITTIDFTNFTAYITLEYTKTTD